MYSLLPRTFEQQHKYRDISIPREIFIAVISKIKFNLFTCKHKVTSKTRAGKREAVCSPKPWLFHKKHRELTQKRQHSKGFQLVVGDHHAMLKSSLGAELRMWRRRRASQSHRLLSSIHGIASTSESADDHAW